MNFIMASAINDLEIIVIIRISFPGSDSNMFA